LGRPLALGPVECQARRRIDQRRNDLRHARPRSRPRLRREGAPVDAPGHCRRLRAGIVRREEDTMKITPLHDRILVKRIEEEEKTKGGIIIPDTAKEKPQEGKVIAVGKGRVTDDGKVQELTVKKGDKVLFSKYAGTEVKLDGEEHTIIREDDVLAILE
jgi:chaperonin GroES